jgi:hypothetical protein
VKVREGVEVDAEVPLLLRRTSRMREEGALVREDVAQDARTGASIRGSSMSG